MSSASDKEIYQSLMRKMLVARYDSSLKLAGRLHTKILGQLNLSVLGPLRSQDSPRPELKEIIKSLQQISNQLREIENELYPPALKTGSFEIALEELQEDLIEELSNEEDIELSFEITASVSELSLAGFIEFHCLLLLKALCRKIHSLNSGSAQKYRFSAEGTWFKVELEAQNWQETFDFNESESETGLSILDLLRVLDAEKFEQSTQNGTLHMHFQIKA